jgi:7-cyano-7-deazaguanine synthase
MQKNIYDAVLLLSGGIDSTTMLYKLVNEGKKVFCLIFDYGQTLIKEVEVARRNAERLAQDYKIVKIDLSFSDSKCSLISDTPIATGKTFDEIDANIPTSYVEFRNGILLSYAVMFIFLQLPFFGLTCH